MFEPVTKKDFIKVGRRYSSDDLIVESDRFLELAPQDIEALSGRGYTPEKLERLREYRQRLVNAFAERQDLAARKKGAREQELLTLEEGRTALRSGLAVLRAAIARRAAGPAAEEEELREKIANLAEQTGALAAPKGNKSAVTRARLETLKDLLARSDFEPAPEEAAARAEFTAELDDILGRLAAISQNKQHLQDSYKEKTAEVNELDGRIYQNMLLLSQVGRAVFQEMNNHQRASLYRLQFRKYHRRSEAAAAEPPPPPESRPRRPAALA